MSRQIITTPAIWDRLEALRGLIVEKAPVITTDQVAVEFLGEQGFDGPSLAILQRKYDKESVLALFRYIVTLVSQAPEASAGRGVGAAVEEGISAGAYALFAVINNTRLPYEVYGSHFTTNAGVHGLVREVLSQTISIVEGVSAYERSRPLVGCYKRDEVPPVNLVFMTAPTLQQVVEHAYNYRGKLSDLSSPRAREFKLGLAPGGKKTEIRDYLQSVFSAMFDTVLDSLPAGETASFKCSGLIQRDYIWGQHDILDAFREQQWPALSQAIQALSIERRVRLSGVIFDFGDCYYGWKGSPGKGIHDINGVSCRALRLEPKLLCGPEPDTPPLDLLPTPAEYHALLGHAEWSEERLARDRRYDIVAWDTQFFETRRGMIADFNYTDGRVGVSTNVAEMIHPGLKERVVQKVSEHGDKFFDDEDGLIWNRPFMADVRGHDAILVDAPIMVSDREMDRIRKGILSASEYRNNASVKAIKDSLEDLNQQALTCESDKEDADNDFKQQIKEHQKAANVRNKWNSCTLSSGLTLLLVTPAPLLIGGVVIVASLAAAPWWVLDKMIFPLFSGMWRADGVTASVALVAVCVAVGLGLATFIAIRANRAIRLNKCLRKYQDDYAKKVGDLDQQKENLEEAIAAKEEEQRRLEEQYLAGHKGFSLLRSAYEAREKEEPTTDDGFEAS